MNAAVLIIFSPAVSGMKTAMLPGDAELNAEIEVRSLTGVGAEKATHH